MSHHHERPPTDGSQGSAGAGPSSSADDGQPGLAPLQSLLADDGPQLSNTGGRANTPADLIDELVRQRANLEATAARLAAVASKAKRLDSRLRQESNRVVQVQPAKPVAVKPGVGYVPPDLSRSESVSPPNL